MNNFLKSLAGSVLEAVSQNEYFMRWRKKYPSLSGFIERRLSLTNPYGFYFSAGFVLSATAFFYFLALSQDILARDPFVEADTRIMNLVAALRNLATAKMFLFFTYLGNWQFIVSLAIIAAVILILLKERRKLTFLVVGVAGGELLYTIFKLLLHRTRPDIGFSLISRNGYSFPSGHATMSFIFYGIIFYGCFRFFKKWWLKTASFAAAIVLIFLIGFSRVYLGVHWVSDILAGWAFGAAFLILLITFFKQQERFRPETKTKNILSRKLVLLIFVVLLILEGAFFYYFYANHPLIEHQNKQRETVILSPQDDPRKTFLADNFPKFSETIVGEKMEPISFIIIGKKEQLVQAFQKSGWFMADEPHKLKNLYNMTIAAILNQQYSTAPVTPSFLSTQPNDFAFEKPTESNSIKQRHHIRFWLTNFQLDGAPVWVATASFDDGLRYFITHKIHPDIDTERDFIKNELQKNDLIKNEEQVQLVKPLLGQNQSGDQFFTDGKAYIIFLK